LILLCLCIGCAVGGGVYDGMTGRSFNYYEPGGEFSSYAIVNAFITFGSVSGPDSGQQHAC
jgi:phospholipid-translocating ATPase